MIINGYLISGFLIGLGFGIPIGDWIMTLKRGANVAKDKKAIAYNEAAKAAA